MNEIIYVYFSINFFIACFSLFFLCLVKYDLLESALSYFMTLDEMTFLFMDPVMDEMIENLKAATAIDIVFDTTITLMFGLPCVILGI